MSALTFTLQLAGPISPSFAPPRPTQRCQLTDEGVSLIVQVIDSAGNPVNLRLASSKKILLVRPSGVKTEVSASYFTNGLDGQMFFASNQSVPLGTGLDEYGIWSIQAKITISGNTQFTATSAFSVGNNLGA